MQNDPLTKGEFQDWAENHHEALKRQVEEIGDQVDQVMGYQAEILEKVGSIKGVNKVMVPLVVTLVAAFITTLAVIFTSLWT